MGEGALHDDARQIRRASHVEHNNSTPSPPLLPLFLCSTSSPSFLHIPMFHWLAFGFEFIFKVPFADK